MRSAGIDIGSKSIEVVLLEEGRIVETRERDSGFDPLKAALNLLAGARYDRLMATGYGRHLLGIALEVPTVTEIKAYAVGAKSLFPEARTILDIGGQDSKAIALSPEGRVLKFEMNDRCAAGTGKFLEIMAHALGFPLDAFGPEALKGRKEIQISSMCTVFAESEVTSLLAKGTGRHEIAIALHSAAVRRAVGMLRRVSVEQPVVFAGGVARNVCMVRLLQESIQEQALVPDNPHMVGALGAALIASSK